MTDALGVFLAMTPNNEVIYRRALLRHHAREAVSS
jgi:hypothetical protein